MEVREKIAERVKKSCEASARQRAIRLGESLTTLGESLTTLGESLTTLGESLALMGKALSLQEVARHCRETLGGLRVEGLGMGSLRADGLGMGIKGMGCLGIDGRLGVVGWEGGGESGKVVEGWSGESREGA